MLVKEEIKKLDATAEYFFKEGCHILELANSPHDAAVSIARARVERGVSTRWHCLRGIVERYVVLEGQGRVEVGELPPATVAAGDVVFIPAGCRQRISNTGKEGLVFMAICSPRFQPQAYVDLEPEDASG